MKKDSCVCNNGPSNITGTTHSLHQYRETLQPIIPGEGISEKMFLTSRHAAKFEIDIRLTYKVNKYKKGKTTKTKKVINPNIMFTLFSVFGERSPGQVRKDLSHKCLW